MKLEDAVEGRVVKYTPFKGCDRSQIEYGVITRVFPNSDFVFVKYGDQCISKGTYLKDIEYLTPKK